MPRYKKTLKKTTHKYKYVQRKKARHTIRHRRNMQQSGGNYERDITERTLEGTPTKALNKFVVSVPGRGVMSGAAYKRFMDELDRTGNHYYD